ncbi:response regulator [Nocardia stercoris]|uniref:DNA-binding response regulator n=1 Tax=Nocardia stercoris TaxID=2483361 RepID=A0A3M2LA99_9NOCA|nr:response regulator transcription factor [Nocardia stercoris]RMI33483.1 DNA-binding response regulator [Nocardia stercoris]
MTSAPPITVLLVDDHTIVREGLRGMLSAEPDLAVVGEAGSAGEAEVLAAHLRPRVILMDLRMPGGDGLRATERILAAHAGIHIVILTTYDTDSDILRAVEVGASGYLLKDASRAQLADAVRAAARGETVLATTVANRLAHSLRRTVPRLSGRELEILAHVAQGKTNASIGRALHISEATVKTHLLRAFAKLEVGDRTAAVTTATRYGLL